MKRIVGGIVLLLAVSMSFGQNAGHNIHKLKLPNLKRSSYSTVFDSMQINFAIADKVTSQFGFTEFRNWDYIKTYRGISGVPGVSMASFSTYQYTSIQNVQLKIDEQFVALQPDTKVFIYGFTSNINEGNRVNKNYSRLLMSAYLQEQDAEYLNNEDNFTSLVIKDKSEFWKRNLINMGYGMSYLAKDNPFMGGKSLAIGFFYLWEALHYIPIFCGPFIGQTPDDKIMIPLIGLSSLIIWKGVFSGLIIGNRYLKINKHIHQSGYKIPRNLEY